MVKNIGQFIWEIVEHYGWICPQTHFDLMWPVFLGSDWVDPEDPTVIAETELLGAANSIEAAAKKLALLKPRQKVRVSKIGCRFIFILVLRVVGV